MNIVSQKPDVMEWKPESEEDIYYTFDGENIIANYNSKVGRLEEVSTLPIYYIKKNHYKVRMPEIAHYLNFFTRFYDLDRDTFFSMMALKYAIDINLQMTQKEFADRVLKQIVSKQFIAKCKLMACEEYKLNINADTSGRFNNTPKITNAQALQIVAISFCFKLLTPLILHFVNTNSNYDPSNKTGYLKCFTIIHHKIIKKFEYKDTPVYNALCRFVVFRAERLFRHNLVAFGQKQMLRGDTLEMYIEQLIREVICVKTLYKLDYRKSCVAFIDGIIHQYNSNYLKENYTCKPYEIDSDETSKDSDDSHSHAEALEMSMYKRDESAAMIADVNSRLIVDQLKSDYKALGITDDEFNFYYGHYQPNDVNRYLFENFYAGKFKDPYAVCNINRRDMVYLLVCLKKILHLNGLHILAQLSTAAVYSKPKVNTIKNAQFIEELTSSPIYKEIIKTKYAALSELSLKDDPILSNLSMFINSVYTLIDYDPKINGYQLEHVDHYAMAHEFETFLAMI